MKIIFSLKKNIFLINNFILNPVYKFLSFIKRFLLNSEIKRG